MIREPIGHGPLQDPPSSCDSLHWDMVCDLREGGIVMVDGETISENGRFMNLEWPGN